MDLAASILSDITVYMKYAKFIKAWNRRENWNEIIDRNKMMHIKKHPHLQDEIETAYNFVYENLDKFSEDIQPMVILQLADAQHRDAFVVDKEINFSACIYNILKLFKE